MVALVIASISMLAMILYNFALALLFFAMLIGSYLFFRVFIYKP